MYFSHSKKYLCIEKKSFNLEWHWWFTTIWSQLWVHSHIQHFPSNMLYSKYCPSNMNFHHNYWWMFSTTTNVFTITSPSFFISGPDHSFKTFPYNTVSFVFQLIHRLAFLFIQSEPPKCSCFFSSRYFSYVQKSQFLLSEKHPRRFACIVKYL